MIVAFAVPIDKWEKVNEGLAKLDWGDSYQFCDRLAADRVQDLGRWKTMGVAWSYAFHRAFSRKENKP